MGHIPLHLVFRLLNECRFFTLVLIPMPSVLFSMFFPLSVSWNGKEKSEVYSRQATLMPGILVCLIEQKVLLFYSFVLDSDSYPGFFENLVRFSSLTGVHLPEDTNLCVSICS